MQPLCLINQHNATIMKALVQLGIFVHQRTNRTQHFEAFRPHLTLKIKLAIQHPTTWSRWTTISKVMSELRDSLQYLWDLRLCLGCSERNINILPPQSNILSTLNKQKEGKKIHPWTAQFIQQHYQQHQCCSIKGIHLTRFWKISLLPAITRGCWFGVGRRSETQWQLRFWVLISKFIHHKVRREQA